MTELLRCKLNIKVVKKLIGIQLVIIFIFYLQLAHVCISSLSVCFHTAAVEEVVDKVKSLLSMSQEWEQKAKSALKQK